MFLEVQVIRGFNIPLTLSSVISRKPILSVLRITKLGVGRPAVRKWGRSVAVEIRGVVIVWIGPLGVSTALILLSSIHI